MLRQSRLAQFYRDFWTKSPIFGESYRTRNILLWFGGKSFTFGNSYITIKIHLHNYFSALENWNGHWKTWNMIKSPNLVSLNRGGRKYQIVTKHSELEWNFCVGFCGREYNAHIWFFHTTGLLRYQGPQKKLKKAKKIFKGHTKATDTFHRNFMTFFTYLDRFDIRIQPIEAIWPSRP